MIQLRSSATEKSLWTLADLPEGVCGVIQALEAEREETERLRRMGLCVGRRITVIRAGPRMIVGVLGTRIGLNRTLAADVRVAV